MCAEGHSPLQPAEVCDCHQNAQTLHARHRQITIARFVRCVRLKVGPGRDDGGWPLPLESDVDVRFAVRVMGELHGGGGGGGRGGRGSIAG